MGAPNSSCAFPEPRRRRFTSARDNGAAIARAIVTLGQSLGLAVIAEGVETIEQRDFVARHDCNMYQGYLFSRPVPADQLVSLVAA